MRSWIWFATIFYNSICDSRSMLRKKVLKKMHISESEFSHWGMIAFTCAVTARVLEAFSRTRNSKVLVDTSSTIRLHRTICFNLLNSIHLTIAHCSIQLWHGTRNTHLHRNKRRIDGALLQRLTPLRAEGRGGSSALGDKVALVQPHRRRRRHLNPKFPTAQQRNNSNHLAKDTRPRCSTPRCDSTS